MDSYGCSVFECRDFGTEPLEREGATLCFVCRAHKDEIERDQWVGWVQAESKKFFVIRRQEAA